MRLTLQQAQHIRDIVTAVLGSDIRLKLFGSRLDDTQRGGDIDLLLESDTAIPDPALVAARISARVSRALGGRKVDILLSAPNLQHLPIHDVAAHEGILL